uniref:Uncharacterized protein n=1 Tax=Tanacetum cinerariifolium TaxID=118510 RepID=A0A6L2NZF2_TANCI|nr:hypothetical protein [Tanacetum cinerariifolium]
MNLKQHQASPGRFPNEAAILRSWGCIGAGSGLQEIIEEELRGSRNYGGKIGRDEQNNKWYQSLLRSFDHKKNNTQIEQNLLLWPSQAQVQKIRHAALNLVEARLVEFKNQEIKLCEKIRGLEFNVESKNNRIERLTNELEELKKEKEGLDSKLTCFQSASKDLDTLLGSQKSDKNKEGLGYSVVPPSCSSLLSFEEDMS